MHTLSDRVIMQESLINDGSTINKSLAVQREIVGQTADITVTHHSTGTGE